MVSWNNLDTLSSYKELADVKPACLTEVMSGDNGAERVKNYSIPMAAFHITMHLSRLMKMYLLHLKSLLMRLSLQTSLRLYITEKLLTLVRRDLFSIT